jgi:hypothetical protein
MELTREEEGMLSGGEGPGVQRAMEILVSLGEIYSADRLVPIRSAQVAGVSYKTIGEAGLEFLRDWAAQGCRVRTLATLNPAGVDLENRAGLEYPPDFTEKQGAILEAYRRMGVLPSCTCTPYLIGNLPRFGEPVAWSESSSVIFANSVLGARTNRESGIAALASALVGRTPSYGLHREENRKATFRVAVTAALRETADYAALGYYVGRHYDGIPLLEGLSPSVEEMKVLGAALATGSISMFHIPGVTPEAGGGEALERVEVGREEVEEAYEELKTADDVDIVCIGCPHATPREILEVLKARPRRETWIYTARQNLPLFERYARNENVRILCDTCMVVSPLREMGIEAIGINSAKGAFYCRNLSRLQVRFDSLTNLLR